jgi:hypothetical protein
MLKLERMIVVSQLEYEVIKPGEEIPDPDFDYHDNVDDKEEIFYASMFLVLLAGLYTQYKDKSPDYILKHVDKDTEQLFKDLEGKVDKLDDVFTNTTHKTLIDAGIPAENLPKARIKNTIKFGKLEQKSTIRGIVDELRNGLKSKAYFYKNRGITELYNIKSNFNQASKRLKNTVESGFRTTIEKAKREAQIFLYGDPLAYWVTMHDDRVCPYCQALERDSPMKLSQMPYSPLHNHCRCEVVMEKDLDLTKEAMKLTYYEYER